MNQNVLRKIIDYMDSDTIEKIIDMDLYIPYINRIFKNKIIKKCINNIYKITIRLTVDPDEYICKFYSTENNVEKILWKLYNENYEIFRRIILKKIFIEAMVFYIENNDYFIITHHQRMPIKISETEYKYCDKILYEKNIFILSEGINVRSLDNLSFLRLYKKVREKRIPYLIVKDLIYLLCRSDEMKFHETLSEKLKKIDSNFFIYIDIKKIEIYEFN